MPIQQIADKQREVMDQSIDILKKFTGKTPTGWLGPGRGQMFDTLDHVDGGGLHLVRRLGARRPADLGEDRERADPGGALLAPRSTTSP